MVSTSIGEEGLDIGQVDLIIAYDAVASATRMTQRFGRTGRKRSGRVIMLATKDEKKKIKKAKASRKKIDKQLQAAVNCAAQGMVSGKNVLTFNDCNPRMLPYDIYPEVIEKKFNVGEFHSSQVAGIGASQSDVKKMKKVTKINNKIFNSKISNSQEKFMMNEFNFDGKSTPSGSVHGEDEENTDMSDEENEVNDDRGGEILNNSYSIYKIDKLNGLSCSRRLQGEDSETLDASNASKTLVSILRRTLRNDSDEDDDDADSFGVQSVEAREDMEDMEDMEGMEVNNESLDDIDEERSGNGNNGVVNDVMDDENNYGMDDYGDDHFDNGFDNQDVYEEPVPNVTKDSMVAPMVVSMAVPLPVAEVEEQVPIVIEQDKIENIPSVSNSQVEEEDDEDDEEDEEEDEMEMENSVAASPPVIAVLLPSTTTYQRGQRIELYDDGKWWKGRIMNKKKKKRKTTSQTQHWVYDVESGSSLSMSQDAWTVYDVEPECLRISVVPMPSSRHRSTFLGSTRHKRKNDTQNDSVVSIQPIPLPPMLSPPFVLNSNKKKKPNKMPNKKKKKKKKKKNDVEQDKNKKNKGKRKRKRLRPVKGKNNNDDEEADDDDDGLLILSSSRNKGGIKKRKTKKDKEKTRNDGFFELEAECDDDDETMEEEDNNDYDVEDPFINDATPHRKRTESNGYSNGSQSSVCSSEGGSMMQHHVQLMMASQTSNGFTSGVHGSKAGFNRNLRQGGVLASLMNNLTKNSPKKKSKKKKRRRRR